MAGDTSNNRVESFGIDTLGAKEKVVQGIRSDDSIIPGGMQIHHNYRPR